MGKTQLPYSAKLLTQADNRQMLEILQLSPIESGGLSICFDREPDIFIMANLKYKPAKYIGIFQGERLLGFGLIGYHTGMFSGLPQQVFHFSNVFMRREFRGKGLFFKAQNLFFQDIYEEACPGYAVIMKGNKNAERFIGWKSNKYPFVPHSSPLNTYDVRNIIITFKKRESKLVVRKARMEDIHYIVSLLKAEFSERLFAPHIDEDKFKNNLKQRPNFSISNYYVVEKGNQIVGTCAAWDCSSFKQIRILKYGKQFKRTKNTFNLFSRFFRFPPLPDAGQPINAIYITDCAVEKRDPEIMNAMLRKIYNEYRSQKFNMIVFGSYKNDRLLKATSGFYYQSVESNIYLLHKDEAIIEKLKKTNNIPYIDVAFL